MRLRVQQEFQDDRKKYSQKNTKSQLEDLNWVETFPKL